MAESTGSNNFPQATVVPKKQRRISIVWIVPLFAAVVALGIAVQRIMYSPKNVSLQEDQRYQNVRIIAVYDTNQIPALKS